MKMIVAEEDLVLGEEAVEEVAVEALEEVISEEGNLSSYSYCL